MNSNYIPELDGIRALAIFMVLARHSSLVLMYHFNDSAPILPFYNYDLFTVFLNGWIGVDLFFVLSGYLISSQFFKDQPPTMQKYALRRILRIVPAYYFVLTVCVLGLFPFYEIPASDNVWNSYILHLLFLQDYTGSDINTSFWSLGVEEKFYILMPILVFFILAIKNKLGNSWVFASILFMLLLGVALRTTVFSEDLYFLPYEEARAMFRENYRHPAHCCLEGFALGILIAFIKFRCPENQGFFIQNGKKIFYIGMLSLFILMSSSNMLAKISWFDVTLQPVLISCIMFLIVLGTVFCGAPTIFKSPFMKWGSTMSYSMYLVHAPLIPLAAILTTFCAQNISSPLAIIPIFLFFFLSIVTLISGLVYWFIERPALKMKDVI